MKKEFKNIVDQYSENNSLLNQVLVSAFLYSRGIHQVKNELIASLLLDRSHPLLFQLIGLYSNELDFDTLIELFEIAIPKKEQQVNGAVYTPAYIKEYIVSESFDRIKTPIRQAKVSDISCGCGAFLFTAAVKIKEKTGLPYQEIFKNLYGLDISAISIERTQILLSLLAISNGEDSTEYSFNLFVGNALNFDWTKISEIAENQGFDIVVGNPPYVRAKNIDKASKDLLANWQVTSTGNPDLYIPFFEIGISLLNDGGVLGYITVNSFFKSVNARSLRTYFFENKYSLSIIDFGHEQVFENKLTYTCLCFINKEKATSIHYTKAESKSLSAENKVNYSDLKYDELDHKRGWLLNNAKIFSNIEKIENAGPSLAELYPIKNGIATLSNDIFIFRPTAEDDKCYYFEKDKNQYSVEKGICRDIIKPNILKTEEDIPNVIEKIIFPYTNGITPLALIRESAFLENYPNAHQYLSEYRKQLDERDKGNGDYGAWYAFGRTQALTDKGKKLMFPYMAKHPHFVYTDNAEMLIYCGYAIFSESEKELKVLKRILESDVFDYYMHKTSKPYASGYFSYAKNYVKHFGIAPLSPSEKDELLSLNDKTKINEFVKDKYEVAI
ncbi:MAG: SAM-dependent DNA methyltransferase [Bacteroidetes bacterium]|nr:SAM-dependent DNA methyltransferase [Bacteroidota bacterium]